MELSGLDRIVSGFSRALEGMTSKGSFAYHQRLSQDGLPFAEWMQRVHVPRLQSAEANFSVPLTNLVLPSVPYDSRIRKTLLARNLALSKRPWSSSPDLCSYSRAIDSDMMYKKQEMRGRG
jgi:hypothetical protein